MESSFRMLIVTCVLLISRVPNGGANCPTIKIENGNVKLNSAGDAFVNCNLGFQLVGNFTIPCLSSGKWNAALPSCIRDCGRPNILVTSNVLLWTTYNGTVEGSSVIFSCMKGYALSSNLTLTCHRNGTWLGAAPVCLPGCSQPDVLKNGDVSTDGGTVYGSKAMYTCSPGYSIDGEHVTRYCQENGQWSGFTPVCKPYDASAKICPLDTDGRGIVWKELTGGRTSVMFCPDEFTGNVSRECGLSGDWKRPKYKCVRTSVKDIQTKVSALTEQTTEKELLAVTDELSAIANDSTTNDPATTLTDEEIVILSSALETVTSVVPDATAYTDGITSNILDTASSLIDQANKESWITLEELDNIGADKVMGSVETLAMKEASQPALDRKVMVKANIVLEIKKTRGGVVSFPDNLNNLDEWVQSTKSTISVQSSDLSGHEPVTYGILYKNMTDILAAKEMSDQYETEKIVNGPVISLTVVSPPNTFSPNVTYVIEHSVEGFVEPSCNFWVVKSESRGHWSPSGCSVVSSNDSITECKCDHLTNFAVLMSPFVSADLDSTVLRLISIVGIGVSLFCLTVTFIVHICLLRYLRSARVTLLMNLCVALTLAYIVFLGGIDRTEIKEVCTCVAAVLHYILLVVFFIMLAEGIDVIVRVIFVFQTKERITILLSAAWVLPAVIVGICLGLTKTKGYGNDHICWLSIDDGLIWAFVGPAAAVILLNIVILFTVIYKILQVQSVKQKSKVGQVKTSIWSLCVLIPVMGISWVFGIFYMNEDLYWMQYVFAVCNGLQGFFVFVVHCVLNAQIRRAFKRAKEKRKRSAAMKNTLTMRNTSSAQKYLDKSSSPVEQSVGREDSTE